MREDLNVLEKTQKSKKRFSVPTKKEVIKIDEDANESVLTISYKIEFIDSARFVVSSLSNFIDNLTERIHKIKCKDCDCFVEYESVKDNLIKYKCLSYSKDYSNKLDTKLTERFKNTFKFYNNDMNKFILLLRKGFYPYGYMNEWEKFNETTLPEKEDFYSNLNMEHITDADYIMQKDFVKTLK